MEPILLPANQPPKFYRGGAAIAEFRAGRPAGAAGNDTHTNLETDARRADEQHPEDWIASTVGQFGAPSAVAPGQTVLPDGRLLRDAITADPLGFLGADHHARFGTDPGLLVKLLDAGQRLPVHVHPDRAFAARHLDVRHGKTEAWIVIGTRDTDAAVYAGFRDPVAPDAVATWVAQQRTDLMLGALNRIDVEPGDTVLIPAGTPHAIGAGVLLVEIQEPTDFSIMLEWKGFGLPDLDSGQLGLSQSVALTCVDHSGWDADRLATCVTRRAFTGRTGRAGEASSTESPGRHSLLPHAADEFFRAEHLGVEGAMDLDPQFAVMVVIDGNARIECADAALDVRRGHTLLIPYGAGKTCLTGSASIVRCMPASVN